MSLAQAPLVPHGTPVVNALAKQRAMLENIMRACVGLPPDNNMVRLTLRQDGPCEPACPDPTLTACSARCKRLCVLWYTTNSPSAVIGFLHADDGVQVLKPGDAAHVTLEMRSIATWHAVPCSRACVPAAFRQWVLQVLCLAAVPGQAVGQWLGAVRMYV